MKPKIPKPEPAKIPIDPEEDKNKAARARSRPVGRESMVSAGRLTSRATTRKASLLGGE